MRRALLAALFAAGSVVPGGVARATECAGEHWVGAWAASPSDALGPNEVLAEQTARMVVHPTRGGARARIRLSNRFGSEPVGLGPVTVALRGSGAGLVPGTVRAVTFAGSSRIGLAPGAEIQSDPVELEFEAFQDLVVSVHVRGAVRGPTEHFTTRQTNYLTPAGTGDHSADEDGTAFVQQTRNAWSNGWFFLTGVDVLAPQATGAVVAFGDSITDGFQGLASGTVENPVGMDENARYPDFLAHRLVGDGRDLAVLNAGISGNKVLQDADAPFPFGPRALDRLDADALDLAGVSDVIALEGINDLSGGATAEGVIAGLGEIVARVHARGLRAHLGTLTPSGGSLDPGYGTAETEARRTAINNWIRDDSAADSVVDFDAAVRDPADPSRMRADFDSSDHLHPSSAGYRAMAEIVDLDVLRGPACSTE